MFNFLGLQQIQKALWSSSKLINNQNQRTKTLYVEKKQEVKPCVKVQQVRHKYVNARMIRDVKRRQLSKEYAIDRLRLLSLKRNDIVPLELREQAGAELHAFPRDSCPVRICKRCVVTSRPRGIAYRWRLSRIVFRHLADYNKLSGIQRAMW